MPFKSTPDFELGYRQIGEAYPLNRARLKRLFRLTVRCAEKAFDSGEFDLDIIAENIEHKARYESSILISIAVAVAIELIKLWLRRLLEEHNSRKN